MARVTGFGGFFFKAQDPQALGAWYAKYLGLKIEEFGGALFHDDKALPGYIVWAPFKQGPQYFVPSDKPYLMNFRVDDLQALQAELRGAGIQVDSRIEESEYGRFGWIMDSEGHRVELWEPPAPKQAPHHRPNSPEFRPHGYQALPR